MAKVLVVISYDTEAAPDGSLPYEVVRRVRPLFDGKNEFEVHLAGGELAANIVLTLADRRVVR